ncbi:MAG TPA: YdcF family protein [Spirochaetota bacterium]|nr:YdcF family protein [Spirochaetota bacterium]HOM38761.1 YdcF family protein [Spirochaetota bacterium]HPQ49559.1 YdcF family protein [Spirochaetota bacterium]
MKKVVKRITIILFIFIIMVTLSTLFVVFFPRTNINENVYEYGIVFGAAIRPKNNMSDTLKSRMNRALELYHRGIIKKLIFTGAKDNQIRPGEPMVMKAYAIKNMVNENDIILDEKGDNTFKSILNINEYISDSSSKVFISSNFHIPRIYITAKILGVKNFYIDSSVSESEKIVFLVFRESLAIWYYTFLSIFYKIFV